MDKNKDYKQENIRLEIDKLHVFIQDYLSFVEGTTDTPDEFLVCALLSCLGAVLGKKYYIRFGHQTLYPNIYMVILGESSVLHKTTAINIAQSLFQKINDELEIQYKKKYKEYMKKKDKQKKSKDETKPKKNKTILTIQHNGNLYLNNSGL